MPFPYSGECLPFSLVLDTILHHCESDWNRVACVPEAKQCGPRMLGHTITQISIWSIHLLLEGQIYSTQLTPKVLLFLILLQTAILVWIVCVCLFCKRGYFDDWLTQSSSERLHWKTKSCHGNSQGWRRRVCLWCCAWSGEMDIGRQNGGGASDAFCGPLPFLLLTKSLLSFSSCLPLRSLVVVPKRVGGCKENKRWISMRQLRGNSFSRSVSFW